MAKNRKAAQDFILKYVEKLLPGGQNVKMYEDYFASMSDKEFDAWISRLGNGEEILAVVVPPMSDIKMDVVRNLKLAKELGHEFFQRVWLVAPDGSKYLTPKKHLVYKLPIRRQAQLLIKKISIPKDNNTIDYRTGQPTGDSKGGKVSYMELQMLSAQGLDNTVTELIKYRGGDVQGFRAMNTVIGRTGRVSQAEIEPYAGGVKSTQVLRAYLTAAHLESDLQP